MNDISLLDQSDTPQLDQSKNYLEELVGPGKKFASAEELARGKAESDVMIELFKKRQDELREDYLTLRAQANEQAKLQDILDRLNNPIPNPTLPVAPEVKPTVDPNQLNSLVSNAIVNHENQKKRTDNFNQVQAKLKEKYGQNAQAFLLSQMDTLGLTADEVNETARRSPNAFYNMMGLNTPAPQDTFNNLPRSSVRTDNFSPSTPKRTWSYYQALKKSAPDQYLSPKIANQMHDDMVQLGEAFKDGDFYN